MTVKLELTPDIEAGLMAQAQASGLSLEAYLEKMLREQGESAATPTLAPAEEWTRTFETWADSFPDTALIPDEALRRENMYPDRW